MRQKTLRYPHAHARSAWRLVPQTISRESQAIAQAWTSLPNYVEDIPGPRTAVVHLRCDDYILQHHGEYGILPNRFVIDRLSSDTEHVTLVHVTDNIENACQWSIGDLITELEGRDITVTICSSPDSTRDWLFMARAAVLFCAPSTFCLTAAWANPNTVFFATNKRAAVVPTDPVFERIVNENVGIQMGGPTMVLTDFLPGKIAKHMTKEAVIEYTQSTHCVTSLHGCVSFK